jgi:shikimate kinase
MNPEFLEGTAPGSRLAAAPGDMVRSADDRTASVYRRRMSVSTSHGPFTVPKTIALVGLMGAGKTAVGRRLAQRLGVDFADADAEIEKAADATIAEIFAQHGEPFFRAREREVVKRLLANPVHVLATGGGAFMDPATRALLRERAITVWLRAGLDLMLARVMRRNHRPLLQNADPRAVLERLIAERYPVYAEADIAVDSVDGPADATLERVMAALTSYLNVPTGAVT